MDSRTYVEDLNTAASRIRIPEGSQLAIVAAGWPADTSSGQPERHAGRLEPNGIRPHLRGILEVTGTAPLGSTSPGRLVLDGVLIEGAVKVLAGHLGGVRIAHATLAPGMCELSCDSNPALSVDVVRTIAGDVKIPSAAVVNVSDTIVLGDVQATHLRIEAATILGFTQAQTLNASNSILLGPVAVQRRQEGCVRFSYLPLESESPRRFRCQPEDAAHAARVRPTFESIRYGDPALVQLAAACAPEIATGADDEGEMGAWHFLGAPLRLKNLRLALDEYLRFGLEAGVFLAPQGEQHDR